MKKFKSIFLLAVLLLIPSIVKAEVTDSTPPVLNDYSFETTTVYNNKTVNIYTDATDDISGVSFLDFNFEESSLTHINDINYHLGIQLNTRSGKVTSTSNQINRVKPGNYTLSYIYVMDGARNQSCYVTEQYKSEMPNCKTIKGMNLVLKDDETPFGHIKDIKISKQEITAGEGVTFTVTVDDPSVDTVYLNYLDAPVTLVNSEHKTVLTKTTNDFKISGQTYNLNSIEIRTTSWKATVYVNDSQGQSGAEMVRDFDLKPYSIKVTGTKDTIPPKMNSIKIDNNKIYAPGILKMYVNATDNIANNIEYVSISYRKKGITENSFGFGKYGCEQNGDNFTCTSPIDQYAEPGTYEIYAVAIGDKSGNQTVYHSSLTDGYEKLDPIEFTIDTKEKSDVVSSTENNESINKIKDAQDNATITLDSTRNPIVSKNIFEAIKGTNKKLYIESKGIQWIFNGNKITNELKDINTEVYIYQNYAKEDDNALNSVNSLVIQFAPNGLLPGVAKIRVKADYAFREFIGVKDLYVFYYDEENEMFDPVATKLDMTEDGYYEFYIEHNSKYIISSTKPDVKFLSKKKDDLTLNNETNDEEFTINDDNNEYKLVLSNDNEITNNENNINKNNNLILIIFISILVILLVLSIIFRKKILNIFKKKKSE